MILDLLDSPSLLSLTLVSRSTRLMALPVLLYRVKLHDAVASGNPRLLSFRTFISDHSLGHHMRHFSYDIYWPRPTFIPDINIVALADILRICGGLVSLTLRQRCERFFLSDSRLAPALLSLPSLVELRLYGIGNVGLHAIRQIHGLRHLSLFSDLFSVSLHSLDVSYIILGLADALEELALCDIIPIWQDIWEQSAAAGIVCLNIGGLFLSHPIPSPKYLAHMFPSVQSLWIFDNGVVPKLFTNELSSLSSSWLWPALKTVKGNLTAVKELALQCPSLQSIIVSAVHYPSVFETESFFDEIPLNRITSISFPLSLYMPLYDFSQSAHQFTSILTRLSVDAPRLRYLSLTNHIQDPSDRINDALQLVSSVLPLKLVSSK